MEFERLFKDHAPEDLREALELQERLGELDFPTYPEEMMKALKMELTRRGWFDSA